MNLSPLRWKAFGVLEEKEANSSISWRWVWLEEGMGGHWSRTVSATNFYRYSEWPLRLLFHAEFTRGCSRHGTVKRREGGGKRRGCWCRYRGFLTYMLSIYICGSLVDPRILLYVAFALISHIWGHRALVSGTLNRIRLRASELGQIVKSRYCSCKSKRLLVRRWFCSCHLLIWTRVIHQLVRCWTHKLQANFDYCYAWRRAEYTSPGPGLIYPSQRRLALELLR